MATHYPDHGGTNDLTTVRSFDSQATCVIDVLNLVLLVLSVGVFTTRHWQMSGPLVHELNVCTVALVAGVVSVMRCITADNFSGLELVPLSVISRCSH